MENLKKDFIDYVNSMDEHVDVRDYGDVSYTSVSYTKDTFWYNARPGFNDLNKEIDHKEKLFGIRSDDNFWVEAEFPYKFRLLDIGFLCEILWEGIDYETSPDSHKNKESVLRLKWEAERSACHFYENREDFRRWEIEQGRNPVKLLLNHITTKWDRYALLEKLDKEDFWYKPVKNFKMHKRYGYISRMNRPRNEVKLLEIRKGVGSAITRKRAKELGILDRWEFA